MPWTDLIFEATIKGKDGSQSDLDLEAQPWGLLLSPKDSLLSASQRQTIIKEIENQLQTVIGPRQWPGNDGLVWPAVSQLYTWALASNNQSGLAWNNFVKHTYSQHSQTFPEVWMGVWSGPDGWVSELDPNGTKVHGFEGGTWNSIVTPMTNFPVSNANPDSMFVFSLLRLLGIEPFVPSSSSSSVVEFPVALSFHVSRSGLSSFSLELPLFSLQLFSSGTAHQVDLRYRAHNKGSQTFVFFLPSQASNVVCSFEWCLFSQLSFSHTRSHNPRSRCHLPEPHPLPWISSSFCLSNGHSLDHTPFCPLLCC